MSSILISGLTKKFDKFTAVSDLNLEVGEKRIFGFLGPNGAGKTTTIRMMVGLVKPTSGKIIIDGEEVVFGENKANSHFGYLPELPSFYGWMTGQRYLEFCADIFDIQGEEREKTIKKLLDAVNLTEAKGKKIAAYSGGMKQRLGIAQALINRPKILILDEPVSALDPIGRKEVLQVLENVKETATVFMSTHILADVDKICDEVAIINQGKLVVQSSLSELKANYAKPILEVEFANDPHEVAVKIKDKNWVTKIEKSGNHLRIWLKDEKIVETNEPLKDLTSFGVGIMNYGLNLPQVEDLFEEAVEKK